MAASRVHSISLVLARCMPSDLKHAAKLKVKLLEFDTNLNMVPKNLLAYHILFLTNSSWSLQHFSKFETHHAHDPKSETKPGAVDDVASHCIVDRCRILGARALSKLFESTSSFDLNVCIFS